MSQVECSPLCSIEWVIESEVVTGEEEDYRLEEEQVEEDLEEDSFSSVISTLTWLQPNIDHGQNFNVECRLFSTYYFIKPMFSGLKMKQTLVKRKN